VTSNKDESNFECFVSILCLKLFVNVFFFFSEKSKASKNKKLIYSSTLAKQSLYSIFHLNFNAPCVLILTK
jgi:hypothetical protein